MAQISVSVSREYGSTITVREWDPNNPGIVSMDFKTYLKPISDDSEPIPYEHTAVHFHGNLADLRHLAAAINKAVLLTAEAEAAA